MAKKTAKKVEKVVPTKVTVSKGTVLIGYNGNADRAFAGKIFKTGDVKPVPARFKNAIDEQMGALEESKEGKKLGFYLVKSTAKKINQKAKEEKEAESKIIPEPEKPAEVISEENK